MTNIYIDTDVFQTWQFDFIYKRSFVEREHVNDDTIGKHTYPEVLESGEYVVNNYQYDNTYDSYVYMVITEEPYDSTILDKNHSFVNLGGIMHYGFIYVCMTSYQLIKLFDTFDNNIVGTGGRKCIREIYAVPYNLFTSGTLHEVYDPDDPTIVLFYEYDGEASPKYHTININKPYSIDGYVPRNNKLLTYPYCYMLVSNNNGTSNVYQYEKFTSDDCEFQIGGIPTQRSFNKTYSTILYTKSRL